MSQPGAGNNLGNLGGNFELPEARAGVELGLTRSQEERGSPELQNGGLRALEEAWITTSSLRHFPVKSGRFLCFWGVSWRLQECQVAPKEVPGGQRKARAPELWPESLERALHDDDRIEAYCYQV